MPSLPVPSVLRGAEKGSFAEDTIVRRLPEIVSRVISENMFNDKVNGKLLALAEDLPHGRIRPLLDTEAPDWEDWQGAVQPFLGQTWLEVPLFAAEMYFYRRILEATGYFLPGPGKGKDPFLFQKNLGLERSTSDLTRVMPEGLPGNGDSIKELLEVSLWGNQADLSLWPVIGERGGRAGGEGNEAHLLIDQRNSAVEILEQHNDGWVDLILDNFGSELVIDLLLADAVLERNPDSKIRLHVKPHPCFVSDAIAEDIWQAVHWLKTKAPHWAGMAADRLEEAKRNDRLHVATHFYWGSPNQAWQMPADLQEELSGSRLLISKGDVNYRRWLGDARWTPSTPLSGIVDPPAPLLLLRVLKSDVIAGLAEGQAQQAALHDPAWQLDGQWGVIQFVKSDR